MHARAQRRAQAWRALHRRHGVCAASLPCVRLWQFTAAALTHWRSAVGSARTVPSPPSELDEMSSDVSVEFAPSPCREATGSLA
jgi:hypothetical protein